jgi:hypothetical protein
MNAQQAIQWPHTTHLPLYIQHSTTHHHSTRSIDQVVHSTASTGARCAAILPLPVLLSVGRRTVRFDWYEQFCEVIQGKTTPEEMYDTLSLIILYVSPARACLAAVGGATFAVLPYISLHQREVISSAPKNTRSVSRNVSGFALRFGARWFGGLRGAWVWVEDRLMNELLT